MAKKIVLSAEELLEQANKLNSLMGQYDSMFKQMTAILDEMNTGWSENLAKDFIEKIALSQKGFSKILEFLDWGANAAKEGALGFTDMNVALAKKMPESMAEFFGENGALRTGITLDMLEKAWPDIKKTMGGLNDLIPEGSTVEEVINYLKDAEEGVFGTEYIKEAQKALNTVGDLFDGTVSSETAHNIIGYFGGYDEILGKIGFSDGLPVEIIKNGVDRIFGDGKNIESISPSMIKYIDDLEQVKETFKEGNYVEAILSGFLRTEEGATKITCEALGDIASGVGDKFNQFADYYDKQDAMGKVNIWISNPQLAYAAALKNDVPWNDVNHALKDATGVDFSNFLPELGKNLSDVWSERVDEAVGGIPVITEFIGEQIGNMGSGVVNGFKGLNSLFK